MKENNTTSLELSPEDGIDKTSYVPAYVQVANVLKQKISRGVYQPGSQLPSEAAIAAGFQISAMTARQAIGLLAEEGLIDRIQGRGTFVKILQFTSSNFGLDSLARIFATEDDISIRIIEASVQLASEDIKNRLDLESKSSVILVKRLILHQNEPLIYQISYALADPESPFVETMLETNVLTGFLLKKDLNSFKKAEFKLLPAFLQPEEAETLNLPEGESVFKLEHTYYDFNDAPAACGWFIIAPEKMPLICRLGVWSHE
jgi:GntR family transcriptional regulator